MAEDWAKDGIVNQLEQARDMSETRSRADLREAIGIGHSDLDEALDELRLAGKISEVAPDEFVLFDSNAAAREEAHEAAQAPEPGVSLEEAEARAARPAATTAKPGDWGDVRVTLDAAVAGVMDADALGKLVEAGIVKAAEREVGFIFEVTP